MHPGVVSYGSRRLGRNSRPMATVPQQKSIIRRLDRVCYTKDLQYQWWCEWVDAGIDKSFELLYSSIQGLIIKFTAKWSVGLRKDQFDDFNQEVLLFLVRKLPAWDRDRGSLSNFIAVVVKTGADRAKTYLLTNMRANWSDTKGRRTSKIADRELYQYQHAISDDEEMGEDYFVFLSEESTADDDIDAADLLRRIIACCGDDRDRLIVKRRLAGYTFQEIGDEIGVSLPGVGKILNRLHGRFDSCL